MSDNPFSEPDDSDRTVVRGAAGAPPPPPRAAAPPQATSPMPAAPRLAGEAEALPKVGLSPLAAAAAPLLDLLARLGAGPQAAQVAQPEELRERAMRALAAFEAEGKALPGITPDQLRAAHYALCAALDDVALATPWGAASGWATRSLVSSFHQEVRSGERFFDLLTGMQKDPGRYLPALEIAYLCLALGFQGRYRLAPRGHAELDRIREGVYATLVQLRGNWERALSPHWQGVEAPHRGPGRAVPAWVAGAVAVALLAFGYIVVSDSVNAAGDNLQARLAGLPPGAMPAIDRSAPPVPPAPPPPPPAAARPDLVDRVRTFLAPEIRQNRVVVDGDAQRLTIRIKGSGMFGSGSATVEPDFLPLLRRIAEALAEERGRVVLYGHSDSQPIRTVRFPSNHHLSLARAEAAMRVIAAASENPARFTAVGRADTEPLASNATTQGREENRRIELVLFRGGVR
ncbi:type VI secretion system protein TssL, long form [Falsiroseomonas selenitidurans]|uniref:Type VI secretion system protein TssL n=1 Tax=Falsiroseomonas selenitidurans TaxID=2716335 RepID=A0ABX1EFU7_9PROT|nr:type VI secretion system protein TssL, long form [Falsiroseomonas selenitidurans]NKC34598.1 type VI secretion system protein TssL [Falsiroseomonas selenitidurans]